MAAPLTFPDPPRHSRTGTPDRRNLRLKHAIVDDGRSTTAIAAAAGTSATTLSGVVSGRLAAPTASLRARIAEAMGRPEHELFEPVEVSR